MSRRPALPDSRFLSTPSARRATRPLCPVWPRRGISIHALREEGDIRRWTMPSGQNDFYPRPPRGGRLAGLFADLLAVRISIHALREEGDGGAAGKDRRRDDFYPRPPRGGRLNYLCYNKGVKRFLSTPSARRATKLLDSIDQLNEISIHALREEGDLFGPQETADHPGISIHALREEGDRRSSA